MLKTTTFLLATIALIIIGAAFFAACGDDDDEPNGANGENTPASGATAGSGDTVELLKVVTTVAPLTNIIKNIGGDRIELTGIVPDGVNSHTFEPAPSDARTMAGADIFIMNGAELEGTSEEIARENLSDASKIYKLADNTLSGDDEATGFLYDFSFPRAEGKPNPHLWMNPQYAADYAALVAEWLGEHDPENTEYYTDNLAAFEDRIDELDAAIREATATVPEQNRKLLTYHDSWAYWARLYGWTVVGAIQPSDFAEPSAQDVANLIDEVKREQIPAVFGSEVFPSSVTEQIASEAGAEYINELSDDAPPGDEDAPEHTYVGMLVFNMRIMIEALGGDAGAFDDFPVENTFQEG